MKTDEAGIVISGRSWSASDFVRADGTPGPWTSKALEADPLSFEAELGRFLTEFFSPGAAVTVHTSGSTGAPFRLLPLDGAAAGGSWRQARENRSVRF